MQIKGDKKETKMKKKEEFYICRATNNQGCTVVYIGSTPEEALAKFDAVYYRKGFSICILDQNGDWVQNIRSRQVIKDIAKRGKNLDRPRTIK